MDLYVYKGNGTISEDGANQLESLARIDALCSACALSARKIVEASPKKEGRIKAGYVDIEIPTAYFDCYTRSYFFYLAQKSYATIKHCEIDNPAVETFMKKYTQNIKRLFEESYDRYFRSQNNCEEILAHYIMLPSMFLALIINGESSVVAMRKRIERLSLKEVDMIKFGWKSNDPFEYHEFKSILKDWQEVFYTNLYEKIDRARSVDMSSCYTDNGTYSEKGGSSSQIIFHTTILKEQEELLNITKEYNLVFPRFMAKVCGAFIYDVLSCTTTPEELLIQIYSILNSKSDVASFLGPALHKEMRSPSSVAANLYNNGCLFTLWGLLSLPEVESFNMVESDSTHSCLECNTEFFETLIRKKQSYQLIYSCYDFKALYGQIKDELKESFWVSGGSHTDRVRDRDSNVPLFDSTCTTFNANPDYVVRSLLDWLFSVTPTSNPDTSSHDLFCLLDNLNKCLDDTDRLLDSIEAFNTSSRCLDEIGKLVD